MDLKSESIVSDKIKFVAKLIPKAATRSLLTFFVRQPAQDFGAYEIKGKEFYQLLDDSKTNYFKFAFIRNPYRRVLSCWLDKINRPGQKTCEDTVKKFPGLLYAGMPLEEFVSFLCSEEKGKDAFADRHWVSQHLFFRKGPSCPGLLDLDYVGKIENLNSDFAEICKILEIKHTELPQKNTHKEFYANSHSLDISCFSDKQMKLIKKRYEEDFELFGY